jgi:uncharacterized sporulation protein YeaH/YhbH (DUF444 family)
MTNRIDEDHNDFHDVYGGKKRKALRKYQNDGSIFRKRAKGGKLRINIPKIDIPFITHGESDSGVGRGNAKKGQVIGKDDSAGGGRGNQPGEGEAEGIDIAVDLDEVFKFMQEELKLPDLRPKPNQTYEEEEIKYNDISLTGPESLRHNPRTLKQALKRQCADGSIWDLHKIPGMQSPMRMIRPIQSDKRFRQYKIIKKPASNAVVFFARDWSYSMDAAKCDIVSDMCYWIDLWIRRFYKRVERVYIGHDQVAKEVSEEKFYKYRYGGGTKCSSALKLIDKQFDNRFPPKKWNIYILYFSDGENFGNDNQVFTETIKEKFPNSEVNLFAMTQVLASYGNLKEYIDKNVDQENVRTTEITSNDERDIQVKKAIIDILGENRTLKEGAGI